MPNNKLNTDPTAGMSKYDLLMAGVGRGMHNTGMGVGQLMGLVNRDQIAEQRRLDSFLLDNNYGSAGNLLGLTASLAPTALVPGANTFAGAGLLGAASGVMQPSLSDKETWANTLSAGLLGPAAIFGGRALSPAMPKRLGYVE